MVSIELVYQTGFEKGWVGVFCIDRHRLTVTLAPNESTI